MLAYGLAFVLVLKRGRALAKQYADTFFDKVKKARDVRPCDGPMSLPVGHEKKYDLQKYPTAKRGPSSIHIGSMK